MTNLVASIVITLVTNTTEVFPSHWVSDPSQLGPGGIVLAVARGHMEADGNPTNKTVITTIIERKTVSFELDGKQSVVIDKPLTNWSQNFKLESEWKIIHAGHLQGDFNQPSQTNLWFYQQKQETK